ncbi:MAG: hypothetical protein RIR29_167 [Actinomycetota bacterium]|jgi:uncharacterized membrane protein
MNLIRNAARILLGAALVFAGTGHLTFARSEFTGQVPPWLPLDPDFVVLASGVVEIALGCALILLKSRRKSAGVLTALFFIAIFPGNIAQFLEHRDAFGLNTDQARATRLLIQPLLVLWALWSTGCLPWRPRQESNPKSAKAL